MTTDTVCLNKHITKCTLRYMQVALQQMIYVNSNSVAEETNATIIAHNINRRYGRFYDVGANRLLDTALDCK